ncbi:MAG: S-layer homology domain-containing protein, partial [Syntrophomonas sp.]|nr:S-layer homology domain-containing protein [Syntrophomonas sp.]
RGLISGVSPGMFEPDRSITRAEFTSILLRTLGIKPVSQVTGRFTDVFADQWYFDPINTAANLGLINGYSDSLFAPQEPVTREQMAVMIDTALHFQGKGVPPADNFETSLMIFTDSHLISPWAGAAVAAAVQQGIIQGRGDNSFAPLENATRAEASILLLKLYQEKE